MPRILLRVFLGLALGLIAVSAVAQDNWGDVTVSAFYDEGTDCNDAANSCTNDCGDDDTDGNMDCANDRCFDNDDDQYGTITTNDIIGSNSTVALGSCHTGAAACAILDAACTTTPAAGECNDNNGNNSNGTGSPTPNSNERVGSGLDPSGRS